MKKLLLIFALLAMVFKVKSQTFGLNLVPNPGFENYSQCPPGFTSIDYAIPWDDPVGTTSSSDFLHTCYTAAFPILYANYPPHTGDGVTRIVSVVQTVGLNSVYSYNEYLQVPLNSPLISGLLYEVSFYVRNQQSSSISTNNLGVAITDNSILTTNFPYPYSMQGAVSPTIPQFTVNSLNTWELVQGTFIAQGGENYLTIGNFIENTQLVNITPLGQYTSSTSGSSHFLIDDVSLKLIDTCYLNIVNTSPNDTSDYLVVCDGDSVDLTVQTVSSYIVPTWNTGYTGIDVDADTSGMYIASFQEGGCNTADTIIIEYVSPPVLNLQDTTICSYEDLEVINPDTSFDASLYYSQLLIGTGDTISTTFDVSLTYNLEQGECKLSSDFTLSFLENPTVSLPADTSLCLGGSYEINSTSNFVDVYSWSSGSDSSSVLVNDTGVYVLEVYNDCGMDTDSINIEEYLLNYAMSFIGDTLICASQDLDVNITGNVQSAIWNDGVNAQNRLLSEGIWWVDISDALCSESDTIEIRFPEFIDLGEDTLLCDDEVLSLALNQGWIDSIFWSDGSTNNASDFFNVGMHGVVVYQEHCSIRDSIAIDRLLSPSVYLQDTVICLGESFNLELDTSYQYTLNGNDITNSYFIQSAMEIELIASNYCGFSTSNFVIEEEDCTCDIYIPNSFTPNSDEYNSHFKVVSECVFTDFHLTVYNRWGEIVFESFEPDSAWDGTMNGSFAKDGSYLYKLEFRKKDEQADQIYGSIFLLK